MKKSRQLSRLFFRIGGDFVSKLRILCLFSAISIVAGCNTTGRNVTYSERIDLDDGKSVTVKTTQKGGTALINIPGVGSTRLNIPVLDKGSKTTDVTIQQKTKYKLNKVKK